MLILDKIQNKCHKIVHNKKFIIDILGYRDAFYNVKFQKVFKMSDGSDLWNMTEFNESLVAFNKCQILEWLKVCFLKLMYIPVKWLSYINTRMTTFMKTKFKKSDNQTNIDKYRVLANSTEYHIISKLILQRIIITNFCGSVSHLR